MPETINNPCERHYQTTYFVFESIAEIRNVHAWVRVSQFCFGENALSNGHLRVDLGNSLSSSNDSITVFLRFNINKSTSFRIYKCVTAIQGFSL